LIHQVKSLIYLAIPIILILPVPVLPALAPQVLVPVLAAVAVQTLIVLAAAVPAPAQILILTAVLAVAVAPPALVLVIEEEGGLAPLQNLFLPLTVEMETHFTEEPATISILEMEPLIPVEMSLLKREQWTM